MKIINRVAKSRNILIEILGKYDWDTTNIPVLSEKEIDTIYNVPESKNSLLNTLGVAVGCNFTIPHKQLPEYKLHVLYYNFPDGDKKSTKVTKALVDKILKLYEENIFNTDDSLLILLNEEVSDTIQKISDTLNIKLKSGYEISESIQTIINEKSIGLNKNHFRNVFIFGVSMFQVNLLKHELVPEHIPIRDEAGKSKILARCNATIDQLPIISKYDNIGKMIGLVPGDICKITRISEKCGDYEYFRVCK